MSKDYTFLANLIHEDLYYIKSESEQVLIEKNQTETADNNKPDTAVTEDNSNADNNEVEKINFKGKNLKKILVLVEEQHVQFLKPEDETFLGKVLMAVGIDLNDIAIINISDLSTAQFKHIETIPHWLQLCFIEKLPDSLSQLDLKLYKNTQHKEIKILWGHPLGSIAGDKELKIQLWQELKLLFNK